MAGKRKTTKKRAKKLFLAKGGRAHIVFTTGLSKDIRALEKKRKKQEADDLAMALGFCKWIKANTPAGLAPTVTGFRSSSFRIVYNGQHPLDPAGSLAAGGRLNVGGAQFRKRVPYGMCGALYTAGTVVTAQKEAGPSVSSPEIFQLTPKRDLLLWDLDSVLTSINDPKVTSEVNSTPMGAIWAEQKVPKLSQILGGFLRNIGGDGIQFRSTKDPGEYNFCFFLSDVAHAAETFDIRKLP